MGTIELIRVGLVRDDGNGTDDQAAISSASDVVCWFSGIQDSDREQFCCLHLDTRSRVKAMEIVSTGTLNASLVHPREVFKAAILNNAASVILAHNHPSGDPTPSREDVELTHRMVNAGEILGIQMMDHIIVTPDTAFVSMSEANLL